ncbi:MAG: 3-deoxy-manno-octulosonate cytidylyltransferase [Bacteroidales bacterium]
MSPNQKIIGIIPARYASVRFPGKPLALLNDRPMIQWVYQACEGTFDYLTVATDDERIRNVVETFGGNAVMTSPEHATGTDRCREVVEILENKKAFKPDIVVNIQGDEPLIRKEQMEELLACITIPDTEIATLVQPFHKNENPASPDMVKVVVGSDQKALYFSRALIPHLRGGIEKIATPFLKHVGIYAYRTEILKKISKLPPSRLEQAESLEQLRWLENGYSIRTCRTMFRNSGVDTPEDLEKIRLHLNNPN